MKKPSKTKLLKETEDRLAGNLIAVSFTVKKVRDALALLGHTGAAERLDITLCGPLAMAHADALRLRRTKTTPRHDDSPENIERLQNIETAAQAWTEAITERRRAGVTPHHPDFKRYMSRIVRAGKALREALRAP